MDSLFAGFIWGEKMEVRAWQIGYLSENGRVGKEEGISGQNEVNNNHPSAPPPRTLPFSS